MKISLKNFGCYENKEFDFEEDKINLICGLSGCGKSTIFKAIHFCLFGIGQKIIKHGKKSCEVNIIYKDLKICRTKKPNKLTVNSYEDQEAQLIINRIFSENFDTVAYIRQNQVKSFINLSPSDKLSFLEEIIFNELNIPDLKDKVKLAIKESNDKMIQIESEINTVIRFFEEMTLIDSESFKKLSKYNTSSVKKTIKTKELKQLNIQNDKAQKQSLITKLCNELTENKVLITQTESNLSEINDLNQQISEIDSSLENIKLEDDEIITKYKEQLKFILDNKNYEELKTKQKFITTKIQTLKEKNIQSSKSKLQELNKLINPDLENQYNLELSKSEQKLNDYIEIQNLKNKVIDMHQTDEGLDKLNENLKTLELQLIDKREKLAFLLLSKSKYDCPECSTILSFNSQNNSLCKYQEDIIMENDEFIKKTESQIRSKTKKISAVNNEIAEYKKYLEQKKKYFDDIIKINDKYSHDLEDSKYDLSTYEADLVVCKTRICDYKKSISEHDNIKYKLDNNIFDGSISDLESELHELNELIDSTEFDSENVSNIDLTEEELREKINEYNTINLNIQNYNSNKRKYNKKINKLKKKNLDLENNFLQNYNDVRYYEDIENEIELIRNLLKDLDTQYEKNMIDIQNLKQNLIDRKNNDKYNEKDEEIKFLKNDEQKIKQEYSAALLLKEKILESEYTMINNIVNHISSTAQTYAELFFIDPIYLSLQTFKVNKSSKTKKVKPQINLQITYKDIETEFNMLSGGEQSRVSLCFTLALAETFNSPLILLDECTSSLDSENTETIFDTLKTQLSDKTILVIAHQVIEGSFDKVLSL